MNAQQVPHGGGVEFERWSEAMRGEFDAFLHETWQAMNKARTGYWIADTEEVMRQARDRLGRCAYEKLLQLRLDAGEAGEAGRPGEVGRPGGPGKAGRPGEAGGETGSEGRGAFSPDGQPGVLAEQGPQADHASDGHRAC